MSGVGQTIFFAIVAILFLASIGSTVIRIVMFHHVDFETCSEMQYPMKIIDIVIWSIICAIGAMVWMCCQDYFVERHYEEVETAKIYEPTGGYKSVRKNKLFVESSLDSFFILWGITFLYTMSLFIVALAEHC